MIFTHLYLQYLNINSYKTFKISDPSCSIVDFYKWIHSHVYYFFIMDKKALIFLWISLCMKQKILRI